MSTDPDTLPVAPEQNPNRILIANIAGWLGLLLLLGVGLYWAITGNNFDLTARIGLILALMALGAFGLLNPQGITDIATGRGTRNILSTALLLALGIGIIIAINVFYGELIKRVPNAILRGDLTAGQQYTLSAQSIKVAQELPGPVTAYAFFGTSTSYDIDQQRQADNLLKEYQKYTGKLKVQFSDPNQDFALANRYGLTRLDVIVFDNGLRHEEASTISEENITGALLRLRNNVQKRVAILNIPSPLAFNGATGNSVAANQARNILDKENYIVLPPYNLVVSPTISVKDVDVMIVPPAPADQPLADSAVRALIDYLDRGGHVLLIGDPLAAPLPGAILQKYGLAQAPGVALEGDRGHLWGQGQPVEILMSTYPDSTITRDMANIPTIFYIAAPIIAPSTPITGFTTTPFLQTTASGEYDILKDAGNGQIQPQADPSGPKPPFTLGIAVEQIVAASDTVSDTTTPKPPATRLVVVGDYDFISDRLMSQPAGNPDLFANMVNWLSQSEERISVRPKDTVQRNLNLTSESSSLIAWSTIVILPVLALVIGGIVWWRRR